MPRVLAAILVLVLLSLPAAAQDLHGWFVVETTSKEGATKSAIVHLTPTGAMAPSGSVRNVQGLTRSPERLAWNAGSLYILMPGERVEPGRVARRVYSITAVPGMVAGWEYRPKDRPQTLPTLGKEWGEVEFEVEGFAAGDTGPAVLLRRETERRLVVLRGSSWGLVDLPWEATDAEVAAPASGDRCRLMSVGRSIGVLVERGEKSSWCVAEGRLEQAEGKIRWRVQGVVSNPPKVLGEGMRDEIACIENQLVRVHVDGEDVTLSILRPGDEYHVRTLTGVGPLVRVAPVDGNGGFVALLSGRPVPPRKPGEAGDEPDAGVAYRLIEITPSNRILYDGPAKQGGPVSVREIQLLSAMLVVVMAAVIVFVLRPERRGGAALTLPKGIVPAEGSRRIMAAILDMGASWLVASMVVRLELSDIARPEVVFATTRGWMAIGSTFAVLFGTGVLLEWQFGMTLGKLLLGCRVVAMPADVPAEKGAEESARGPVTPGVSLLAAVARNAGKWTPWNVAEFLATGRSRTWADRVSKTVVVVPDVSSDQEQGS